jgi:hypothetical protein
MAGFDYVWRTSRRVVSNACYCFFIESGVESVMEVLRQEVFTWGALKPTLE